jgi:VanZ family protein
LSAASVSRLVGLWLPSLIFVAMVLLFANPATRPDVELSQDKLLHGFAYGVFGLCNLRAAHGGMRALRPSAVVLAFVVTLGFGALDEWNQIRFPLRDASVHDWMADAVGAIGALALFGGLSVRQSQKIDRRA